MVGQKRIKREIARQLKKQYWAKELTSPPEPSKQVNPVKTIEPFSEAKIQPLRSLQAKRCKAKLKKD